MHRDRDARRRVGLSLVSALVVAAALTAAGCTPAPSAMQPGATAPASGAPAATAQLCAACGGMGDPKEAVGAATVENGTQVVTVAIVDGYYKPNKVTVKADMPVRVVFTGSAKGCVAKPKFSALSKSTDVTASGSGTIELGTLSARWVRTRDRSSSSRSRRHGRETQDRPGALLASGWSYAAPAFSE
jgi:hypothetical protein